MSCGHKWYDNQQNCGLFTVCIKQGMTLKEKAPCIEPAGAAPCAVPTPEGRLAIAVPTCFQAFLTVFSYIVNSASIIPAALHRSIATKHFSKCPPW